MCRLFMPPMRQVSANLFEKIAEDTHDSSAVPGLISASRDEAVRIFFRD